MINKDPEVKLEVIAERAASEIKAEKVDAENDRVKQQMDVVTPRVLALIVVIGFFTTLFWMLWQDKDTAMLVGALIVAFTAVLAAHFGHTTSSGRKTEALIKQLEDKK